MTRYEFERFFVNFCIDDFDCGEIGNRSVYEAASIRFVSKFVKKFCTINGNNEALIKIKLEEETDEIKLALMIIESIEECGDMMMMEDEILELARKITNR